MVANANEKKLARLIGGEQITGNKPIDVLLIIDGVEHGFEVKTLVDNKNNKITMHKPSLARKKEWLAEKENRVIHTVIFDERDTFNDGEGIEHYSGRKTYYREGVGSFRIKRSFAMSMAKIKEKFKKDKS